MDFCMSPSRMTLFTHFDPKPENNLISLKYREQTLEYSKSLERYCRKIEERDCGKLVTRIVRSDAIHDTCSNDMLLRICAINKVISIHVCNHCELRPQNGLKLCGRCGNCWYCSRSCQIEDWNQHKTFCKKTHKKHDNRKFGRVIVIQIEDSIRFPIYRASAHIGHCYKRNPTCFGIPDRDWERSFVVLEDIPYYQIPMSRKAIVFETPRNCIVKSPSKITKEHIKKAEIMYKSSPLSNWNWIRLLFIATAKESRDNCPLASITEWQLRDIVFFVIGSKKMNKI